MEEPFGRCLLPSSFSLLSGGTVQPVNNLFPYPQGDRSGLRKLKKDNYSVEMFES